jgi:tartrate dehydratase beta subunit/fumarate hydratase class I family protein
MRAVGSELDRPAQHAGLPHPAGLTTSTRLDKFTRQLLTQTGLLGTIGKAERGPDAGQPVPAELDGAITATINGISAGLRNTG